MTSRLKYSAVFAEGGFGWEEALSVFASRRMVKDSASSTSRERIVTTRMIQQSVFGFGIARARRLDGKTAEVQKILPPISGGLCASTPVPTSSIPGVLFDPGKGCYGERYQRAQGFFGSEVDCVVLVDAGMAWAPVKVEASAGR